MTHSQAIKRLHTEIYNKYTSNKPVISSWREYLQIHYELASEAKRYDRAALIMDLIRFDTTEPGPHTDEELNELLSW